VVTEVVKDGTKPFIRAFKHKFGVKCKGKTASNLIRAIGKKNHSIRH
jgi:hypothetical protein